MSNLNLLVQKNERVKFSNTFLCSVVDFSISVLRLDQRIREKNVYKFTYFVVERESIQKSLFVIKPNEPLPSNNKPSVR